MGRRYCQLGLLNLTFVIMFGLLVACIPPATEESIPPGETPVLSVDVIDQAGRIVKMEKVPEKIVSLAPSNTEILYALHLEEKLVGVTEYCDYPEGAIDKPKIGGFSSIDIEKVIKIHPDLILAANIHRDEVIPQLERLGLTVLVLDPQTVNEVLEAITLVGKCTGKEEEAFHLVAEMQKRIRAVTDKMSALTETQRPRVLYILWHDPLMTAGSETRIHELIVRAGGINIAQDLTGDYPTMSLETVILANPEVIIAGGGHGSGEDSPFQFASTETRLREVDAHVNSRVYEIDSDLTSRPGPRIVDGLEKLAEFIHPELFKEAR